MINKLSDFSCCLIWNQKCMMIRIAQSAQRRRFRFGNSWHFNYGLLGFGCRRSICIRNQTILGSPQSIRVRVDCNHIYHSRCRFDFSRQSENVALDRFLASDHCGWRGDRIPCELHCFPEYKFRRSLVGFRNPGHNYVDRSRTH